MAVLRCPSNVSSVTLVTSGVLVPSSGLITATAAEATEMVQSFSKGAGTKGVVKTNLANGAMDLQMPASVLSITINGNVYVPSSNVIAAVPAADAMVFLNSLLHRFSYFHLVTG